MTDADTFRTGHDGHTPAWLAELDELVELAAYLGRTMPMRSDIHKGDRHTHAGQALHLLNADSFIL